MAIYIDEEISPETSLYTSNKAKTINKTNKIILLVKNIQFFTYEVHPDRIDEIGNWQDVIDLDFDLSDESVKQITTDYYEFDEVLKENP